MFDTDSPDYLLPIKNDQDMIMLNTNRNLRRTSMCNGNYTTRNHWKGLFKQQKQKKANE